LFLCTPNNPTGLLPERRLLERLRNAVGRWASP
jgi:histidinol-phosphate/aromatic aminotransferase/cobyric acid decarboxylase-like protein